MIIKAQSPAGFAEEYIVKSIWNNKFPPGSILPAERELSELIGVTRTTLREVLQRLARDGWLTIQHGKPTRVNNFWETSGLNILETIARLDQDGVPELMDQLLAARTNISGIYTRSAVRNNPAKVRELLAEVADLPEEGAAYAEFDYRLNHSLAFASGNPIYSLILNGFKGLYSRVGRYYFDHSEGRDVAKRYYAELDKLAQTGDVEAVLPLVRQYGMDSGRVWQLIRSDMPADIAETKV
ncbi:fatty acid metabolism transcriptional regulator FadR [Ferrimonas marina]|uniref:Fatty acid metabolism regulator protein n=1 Tax=Ferrimonas marina TaxID=299255 RepID=A0A1M5MWZ3_9GAMM|nr:fatty acid metabolism transcriptional regulator FadR [Ferrimonas marina]SHG81439.1 GntR family transcriptional regulator, negative regulator for fad regulon and positive regulator of fabA [Ferrimonas marina]